MTTPEFEKRRHDLLAARQLSLGDLGLMSLLMIGTIE